MEMCGRVTVRERLRSDELGNAKDATSNGSGEGVGARG